MLLYMPKAPALHRHGLVDARTVEWLASPERFGVGLVGDIQQDQAADGAFAAVVEQRPTGDDVGVVLMQIRQMRLT